MYCAQHDCLAVGVYRGVDERCALVALGLEEIISGGHLACLISLCDAHAPLTRRFIVDGERYRVFAPADDIRAWRRRHI